MKQANKSIKFFGKPEKIEPFPMSFAKLMTMFVSNSKSETKEDR